MQLASQSSLVVNVIMWRRHFLGGAHKRLHYKRILARDQVRVTPILMTSHVLRCDSHKGVVKETRTLTPYSVPHFVDQLNDTMGCKTGGCQGKLTVREVTTRWEERQLSYACALNAETSWNLTLLPQTPNSPKMTSSWQHRWRSTYTKVLKHVLGIKVVSPSND